MQADLITTDHARWKDRYLGFAISDMRNADTDEECEDEEEPTVGEKRRRREAKQTKIKKMKKIHKTINEYVEEDTSEAFGCTSLESILTMDAEEMKKWIVRKVAFSLLDQNKHKSVLKGYGIDTETIYCKEHPSKSFAKEVLELFGFPNWVRLKLLEGGDPFSREIEERADKIYKSKAPERRSKDPEVWEELDSSKVF